MSNQETMSTPEPMPTQAPVPPQEPLSTPEPMPNQEPMPVQELSTAPQESVPTQELARFPQYNPPSLSLDTITTVTMPVLYPGNNGEAVRFLQQLLLLCGFRIVKFNANFDRYTYYGVMEFQRNHGLVVDGVVGWHTWRKLGEVLYSRHRYH
ncbi:MAG: hypothetical protein F6K58_09785 [Symploca sp. SIO2E9]|nr:hypothetical protein [Symploca sp. SIO2E9]